VQYVSQRIEIHSECFKSGFTLGQRHFRGTDRRTVKQQKPPWLVRMVCKADSDFGGTFSTKQLSAVVPSLDDDTRMQTVGRDTITYRSMVVAERLRVHQSNGDVFGRQISRQHSQHEMLFFTYIIGPEITFDNMRRKITHIEPK
jgi:hypothetical protein